MTSDSALAEHAAPRAVRRPPSPRLRVAASAGALRPIADDRSDTLREIAGFPDSQPSEIGWWNHLGHQPPGTPPPRQPDTHQRQVLTPRFGFRTTSECCDHQLNPALASGVGVMHQPPVGVGPIRSAGPDCLFESVEGQVGA